MIRLMKLALTLGCSSIAAWPGIALAQGEVNAVLKKGLASEGTAKPETTVFVARKIVTMERSNPEATAVAVSGNRIVAVGSLESVKAALGGGTITVDETFKEKVVMPGFIDQHLHPVLGALTLSTEVIAPEDWVMPERTFRAASTPAEYIARLRAAEAALKDPGEWLFTWGYHRLWHGQLGRKVLDQVSATRPIVVWQRSVHEFYLNSAAIRALGLKEEAMKGKGDASKMVSWEEGHWWETGLNLIAGPLLKVLATPERMTRGLRQLIAYEHAKGVTALNEPGAIFTPQIWTLYERLLGAEDTPFYSTFIVDGRGFVDAGVSPEDALAQGEAIIARHQTGKVAFLPKQIKLFADGAIISQLMQMKGGYTDGHHGEWLMTPENLEIRTKLYWNAGYQIHVHVNGDLGLEVLLDTLERRMRENPRADHRSVIAHFANSSEDEVARIARLGAIVSANPYYTVGFADRYAQVGLGLERADSMVRSASVLRRHVPLSFHSDLPMGPSDPLYLAWCGVNRLTPSGRVADAKQKISVDDALRAITIEAAYSWRKENELGSIAPGKVANFTVLEQNPYEVPPARLKDVPLWGTVFEGRLFPAPRRPAGRKLGSRVKIRHAVPTSGSPQDVREHAGACPACAMAGLSQTLTPQLDPQPR